MTGVGTLINAGDFVDVVVGITGDRFPVITIDPETELITPIAGINATSVKLLVQGAQVVGTLLPPAPAPQQQAAGDTTGTEPETTLTGQQQLVFLAVTAQQEEVIKFAQLDGSISLVLRSAKDFPRDPATREVIFPPVLPTTGITLHELVNGPWGVSRRSSSRPSSRRPWKASRTTHGPIRTVELRPSSPRRPTQRRPDGRRIQRIWRPSDFSNQSIATSEAKPLMADQIRVLIVDDIPETRDHLTKLLGFETDIEVVGSAASGAEAIEQATRLTPDVVLMDINMPDMDGITATELLSAAVPSTSVVMMSVQGEADYLRRSMLAGAREFLVKPFSSDELTASIRQVYSRERDKIGRMAAAPAVTMAAGATPADGAMGQIVAVFGPKGGVGRTTIAVNLAVAAGTNQGQKTVIVDGSFQFGDVGVLLNLNPKNKSIADLLPELEHGEPESLDTFVINHSAGIRVLLAPPTPETAELVTVSGVKRVLEALRATHDLVIVDCTSYFNDTTLAILDHGRCDPHGPQPRNHEHQEHSSLPRGGRAARLRGGQGPARPEPRRFDAGHPHLGRRAFDRTEGGSHDRERRPQRRLCAQSRRTVRAEQPRDAGLAGHLQACDVLRQCDQPEIGSRRQPQAPQKKSLFAWR